MKHQKGVLSVLPLIFLLAVTHLFSKEKKFEPCYQKNSQSIYNVSNVNCLATAENELVCHDPLNKLDPLPNGYHVKNFDPFARLYKIASSQKLSPIKFKDISMIDTAKELALIDKNGYELGVIKGYQNGLDSFGRFSLPDTYGKVIGAKCYSVVAMGSEDSRYIASEYIKNFISKSDSIYSDIGIRLKESKNRIFVERRDVFFPANPFLKGDEIISIGSLKTSRLDQLTNKILFEKQGAVLDVKIKREGKIKKVKVKAGIRYGGGYLTDTFLERFGIYFDKELRIIDVKEGSYSKKAGLKKGDRIIMLDGKKVSDLNTLSQMVSEKKNKESSILFERDDFQFFFTIQ